MSRVLYGEGGYLPALPFGNKLREHDDTSRTVHDYTSGQDITRPYTAEENTEADTLAASTAAEQVAADLRALSAAALDTNRTFLNVASPTNAQTVAQVKALTRQNIGLIRLVLNKLDGTD